MMIIYKYIQVTSLKAPLAVDFPAIFDWWTVSSGWCKGTQENMFLLLDRDVSCSFQAALKPSKNQLRI